jgi:hypothetical protein
VDLDYLRWVLDQCPDKLGVELTGGEIGLVPNINEVYEVVRNHPHVQHIIALSNGLLRKKDVDWLKDIEYWEHLINDIEDKNIIKFYDDLDLKQDHRYVIVTTEKTTRSLLTNWSYFEDRGLFRPNFFYKLMNHKSNDSINRYFDHLVDLYTRLGDIYFQRMLIHYYTLNKFNIPVYANKKAMCQKWPPNIYVDLQKRILGHCAMNVNQSIKVEFSKNNLYKMMCGELNENTYCGKCYSFDNGKIRNYLRNRSYEQ